MSEMQSAFGVFGTSNRVPLLPQEWAGWRHAVASTTKRLIARLVGLALIVAAVSTAAAVVTYSPNDPSWNNASGAVAQNALGPWGANIADALWQSLGLFAWITFLPLLAWGFWLIDGRVGLRLLMRTLAWLASAVLLSMFLALFPSLLNSNTHAGLGGAFGDMSLSAVAHMLESFGIPTASPVSGVAAGVLGLMLYILSLGFNPLKLSLPALPPLSIANPFRGLASSFRGMFASPFPRKTTRIERREPSVIADDIEVTPDDIEDSDEPLPIVREARVKRPEIKKPGKREALESQPGLRLEAQSEYQLPPLTLLEKAKTNQTVSRESDEALEQNARMLESVLSDFGVRGQITQVRPGPVVTLYEFEPAAGIRSSRVVSLADDIARSMSAVSARVAAVPGRNVIGIELPNQRREKVLLRDLLSTHEYEGTQAHLVLALGKNIGGDPVIADLTRMPHLLIAGTTGSGKSVAINTMILSLLYRMPPSLCKLIMIDPKMLELSTYDGIPHLLSPVVTDPKKAIVALKWTVREMEDRYRRMSKVGVRNILGYNERIARAKAKGETLKRTIQTGFDGQSGEPVFEEETLPLDHMPYIVVVVDEMADLMMVAGKDIEAAVQRLAQMARAAGIHIITATQRPSVDVITGTIKANFPTRVSFQVTSKIDSRTILGEQGAEQLLGQGDMLFMEGGGRIRRVHGPFVSDEEVEAVVKFLKSQGEPSYLDAITEELEEPDTASLLEGEGEGSGDDLYDQAVAIVSRDRKVSTSYVQRRLQIGYNRAARIIEKMEEEGVISAPNHSGKREVLVGDHSGRHD
ncbi:MAG: DNA translocase FtsK [Alphaproteobacteria bacterium]|nr:DNA translocase FtsK [Alphaproteobacteria bacterium]